MDILASLIIGIFLGVLVSAFAFMDIQDESLDECRKANNVYECEYIAVPKAQEADQ